MATVAAQVTVSLARQRDLKTTAVLEADLFDRKKRAVRVARRVEDPAYLDRVRLAQNGIWEAPNAVIDLITHLVHGIVGMAVTSPC